jgi:hypothetical protein
MTLNNISEQFKINWYNVFALYEFIENVDIKSLVDFSLVSKFCRNRSISRLFYHSALIGENYPRYLKSNLIEYEGKLAFDTSSFIRSIWNLDLLNSELRERLVNISERSDFMYQLINESSRIEPFTKSLRIQDLGHILYALYPFTFSFTNLILLEINFCTFPLLALLRIGESLKKLKSLTLSKVVLIEFEKQELSSNSIYFSSCLEELELKCLEIATLNPKSSEIYIVPNHYYKECNESNESNCFDQLKSPGLKRLYLSALNTNYIMMLLNINTSLEEFTIMDFNLEQIIIDKFSAMQNLTKLSIKTDDPEFPIITRSGFRFPQFNFITNLALELTEHFCIENDEFTDFTDHFPNLTQLSLDITRLNFENIDIGKFFFEALPSHQNLEILTLVYTKYEVEDSFIWLEFIDVDCLILDFIYVQLDQIDFDIFSYKVREVRIELFDILLELDRIDYTDEMYDEWNITYDERYIYFNK